MTSCLQAGREQRSGAVRLHSDFTLSSPRHGRRLSFKFLNQPTPDERHTYMGVLRKKRGREHVPIDATEPQSTTNLISGMLNKIFDVLSLASRDTVMLAKDSPGH